MGQRGGVRPGAGRPRKVDETETRTTIIKALKKRYNAETDEEAQHRLIGELMEFDRGKIFISEHVFGKPKDNINIETETPVNINLSALSSATLLEIKELYDKNSTDRIG